MCSSDLLQIVQFVRVLFKEALAPRTVRVGKNSNVILLDCAKLNRESLFLRPISQRKFFGHRNLSSILIFEIYESQRRDREKPTHSESLSLASMFSRYSMLTAPGALWPLGTKTVGVPVTPSLLPKAILRSIAETSQLALFAGA